MSALKIGYLVEHVDRESFLLSTFQKKFEQCCPGKSLKIDIISISFTLCKGFLSSYDAVITPYLPNQKSALGAVFLDFVSRGGTLLVLHWEQYLSEASLSYRGNSIKQFSEHENIYHVSWHDGFTDFLIGSGVDVDHVFLWQDYNVFQLLNSTRESPSYSQVPPEFNKFVFLPLNYAWAFASEVFVENRIRDGYSVETAVKYIKYSQSCLEVFLKNLVALASKKTNIFFLVRPHPSISVEDYESFLVDKGLSLPKNIHISKQGDARDLLLLADFVVSSWSTLALHRYIIDKKSALFTPSPRPDFLNVAWNDILPNLFDLEEIFDHVESSENGLDYVFSEPAPWVGIERIFGGGKVIFMVPYGNFWGLFSLFSFNIKNQLKYMLSLMKVYPKTGVLFDHPSFLFSSLKSMR